MNVTESIDTAAESVTPLRGVASRAGGGSALPPRPDQNPTSIRHQLKSTIDAEIEYDLQSFAALQANLKARLQPFLEYPEAIHAKNALDHSLWSATSLLCNKKCKKAAFAHEYNQGSDA